MKYNEIKSFTLIEMLAVITIIGILASIIFFSTNDAFEQQKKMEVLNLSIGLKNKNLDSLVSEWTFDGPTPAGSAATNSDVRDSWGYNHGDITGHAPTVREGEDCVSEKCLEFDGTNYVELGNIGNLKKFTFSFWVNPFELNVDSNNNYRLIITSSTSYFVLIEQAGGVSFRIPGVTTANFVAGKVPINKFTFVTCMYNQQYRTIYVNGVKVGEENIGSGTPNLGNINLLYPYNGVYAFKGRLDSIRVYDSALSISEIKQNYIAGLDSLFENGAISKEEYNKRLLNLAKND